MSKTFFATTRALVVLIAFATSALAAPEEIRLWPGAAPGETGPVKPAENQPPKSGRKIERILAVADPTVTVYRAPARTASGCTIVVCPGGGYEMLAWDLEGTEIAQWLNSIGVTAVVLKYRVPRRDAVHFYRAGLQDAQRAIRLTRHNAAKWGVDPDRVGILGFSAGGHMTVLAGTHWDQSSYEPVDAMDQQSARPDFLVPIYPSYLTDKSDLSKLHELVRITAQTPPTFIAVTQDDGKNGLDSARLFIALKEAGVPSELHVYSTGGHGYGLRPTADPVTTWPDRLEDWLRVSGLLEQRSGPVAKTTKNHSQGVTAAVAPAAAKTPATKVEAVSPPISNVKTVTVETSVPISTTYDADTNRTLVSTSYVRFPARTVFSPKIWIQLRHSYAGKEAPTEIESVDMVVLHRVSAGQFGGKSKVRIFADEQALELSIRKIEKKSKRKVKRQNRKRRMSNEVKAWVEIPFSQLEELGRSRKVVFENLGLELSREQIALFAAMHRQISDK